MNPCFLLPCPATSADALSEPFRRRIRFNEQARTYADVISIVITVASVWKHPKSQYWTACFRDQNGRQRRISTKETDNKKALKIAEEFERAAKTKRTLKQVQNVLDRLHEEVSGQRAVRTTFSEYLSDWLMAKKAEAASSTMDFYQTSLRKFVQFLGQRADEPIGEITKQDVVAFRHSLVGQVSAKTVNHDLKALKMLFKSARIQLNATWPGMLPAAVA